MQPFSEVRTKKYICGVGRYFTKFRGKSMKKYSEKVYIKLRQL